MRAMQIIPILCLALGTMVPQSVAVADVVESAADSFVVTHRREVSVSAAELFQAVGRIELWWDAAHTYSADSANLSLDLVAGGMFKEILPGGGSVEHLRVTAVMPDRMVRFEGCLGPLASIAISGVMTWSIEPGAKDDSAVLDWRYEVFGKGLAGVEGIAIAVDGVLAAQIDRLVEFSQRDSNAPNSAADGLIASPAEQSTQLAKLKQETPHTWTAGGEVPRIDTGIETFAHIAGRWVGPGLGGECEETWSPPAAGQMQGMFQLVKQDRVILRELFALHRQDGRWVLSLKHFGPDLDAWEEASEVVDFVLLAVDADHIYFDGLTIETVSDDRMNVYVASTKAEGEVHELKFEYRRK
jgi:hypothetical protein